MLEILGGLFVEIHPQSVDLKYYERVYCLYLKNVLQKVVNRRF